MNADRRQFGLGMTAALMGLGAGPLLRAQKTSQPSTSSKPSARPSYFFKTPIFETTFLICLGRSYHSGGDVGKVLYLTKQVEDGDFESAYLAFKQAGDEARALAEKSASHDHNESARQAYLWAQNFYDASTYFVDGSHDPTRFPPTWELLYDCWLKCLPLFDPPIESVNIPYQGTVLHGFYFRGNSNARKRPLLILANGSDGSLLDMWLQGGAGATVRGYDCLTFDGPGQGYALWKQHLYFRPDWERVITPVVDYVLTRPHVDSKRIALQGISQGGYWVSRAVAFEKRIAAVIADPGVVDVATAWIGHMPPQMLKLLKTGQKAEFDDYLSRGLTPALKANLNFRMRPYGFTSYFDAYNAVLAYNLKDVARQIQCPILITDPVNEAFWPGQSRQLLDLVTSPVKKLAIFSESDGADLHCEPKGIGLRDLRVFNWLDETLSRS
ncbi:MAG: prolyl oligopeptidase family serine peptidase [Acidobacteriaceae bacterium]